MYASFSGHVGRDSEVFTTKTGQSMLKFSVADEVYANGKKETQWINCVDFRKSSYEKLIDYVKKGSLLHVSGEVSLNTYEGKDGTMKSSLQCVVSGIRLHGNKNAEAGSSTPRTDNKASAPGTQVTVDDDDVTF